MPVLHGDLRPSDGIHPQQRWTFTDPAQMLAYGASPTDTGGVAYVQSEDAFYDRTSTGWVGRSRPGSDLASGVAGVTLVQAQSMTLPDRSIVSTTGRTAHGDRKSGRYMFVLGDTTTADGGRVVTGLGGRLFLLERTFNVLDYGADPTGAVDSAVAIEAAGRAASLAGGGVVGMPQGTYLLATRSVAATAYVSMITPYDNVVYRGEGAGTVLKLANRAVDLPSIGTGPMIFGRTGILKDAGFCDFTIDYNGANNLLTSLDAPRNMAGIFAIEGGTRVRVSRVRFVGNPGNQCVFFPSTSDAGQGDITIDDCEFTNCGSGLPGNYNLDHSSLYLHGSRNKVVGCRFRAGALVEGSPVELHGDDYEVSGCTITNYEFGAWFASDFAPVTNLSYHHNVVTGCVYGVGFSMYLLQPISSVSITDCVFSQRAGAVPEFGAFIAGDDGIIDRFRFERNFVTGVTGNNCQALLVSKMRNPTIRGNTFERFDVRAIGFGGIDIGGGYLADVVVVRDNTFVNCVASANLGTHAGIINIQAAAKILHLDVGDNRFLATSSIAAVPMNLNVPADSGGVSENQVSPSVTGQSTLSSQCANVALNHTQPGAPAAVTCKIGSVWVDSVTGSVYRRVASGWASDATVTTFAPTLSASGGGASIGNGTLVGNWTRSGATITTSWQLTVGSTTAFGTGDLRLSLPVTPDGLRPNQLGTALMYDVAAGQFHNLVAFSQASLPYVTFRAEGYGGIVSGTAPVAFNSGDILYVTITYIA